MTSSSEPGSRSSAACGLSSVSRGGTVLGGVLQLQDGVLLQLLLDALLQRHDGQLQDFHRLDHAGGQDHPLVQPLLHAGLESHGLGTPYV